MQIFLNILKVAAVVLLVSWKTGHQLWQGSWLAKIKFDPDTLKTLEILTSFALFVLGLNLFFLLYTTIYRRRRRMPRTRQDNVLLGLQNIYILLMWGAGLATVLSLAGVDFQSLFTGLSIVAAAIAIITKDYIANVLSGIGITFSKEFSIGDYIRLNDRRGRVIDITLSKTALLTDEDDVVFIPNNHFFLHDFVNHTKKGIRTVIVEFEMGISALATVEELETELIQALHAYHEYIEAKSFNLRIEEIKKDSLSLKFQYVLKRTDRQVEREIRKKTVRRVVDHIRRGEKNEPPAS